MAQTDNLALRVNTTVNLCQSATHRLQTLQQTVAEAAPAFSSHVPGSSSAVTVDQPIPLGSLLQPFGGAPPLGGLFASFTGGGCASGAASSGYGGSSFAPANHVTTENSLMRAKNNAINTGGLLPPDIKSQSDGRFSGACGVKVANSASPGRPTLMAQSVLTS